MTREEAIKGLKVLRKDFSGYKPNEEMFDMAIKALEQEPKTGHWINIDATRSKCDTCWAIFEITSSNGEINYCPNCGSIMEVEE